MIGKNIKSLRKTHDLTQHEFARIIGISRNSLSRYENGTSSVSTELIDIICQKFNVSYVDIVGEDKMLNPVEDYELTLKIEIVKEVLIYYLDSIVIKIVRELALMMNLILGF